jgi:hypothetical protein
LGSFYSEEDGEVSINTGRQETGSLYGMGLSPDRQADYKSWNAVGSAIGSGSGPVGSGGGATKSVTPPPSSIDGFLPEGYKLNDQIIPSVPNYYLYGGAAALALWTMLKRRR